MGHKSTLYTDKIQKNVEIKHETNNSNSNTICTKMKKIIEEISQEMINFCTIYILKK